MPMLLGSNRDEGFMFLAEDPSEEVDISQPGEEGGGYGGGGRKNRHPFDVGALLAWVEANFGDGAARWGPGAARHAHRHQHRHRHHRHQVAGYLHHLRQDAVPPRSSPATRGATIADQT